MKEIVKILKALANERRLKLLKEIYKAGSLNVGDAGGMLMLSFRSTSKHLQKLRDAGLLEARQVGAAVHYYASKEIDPKIKTIIEII